MAELSKQALKVENNTEFPNNNNGQITPSRLRTFNEDMIDSTVNQAVYTADSASFNTRINNASVDTGSLVTTSSFNAYTQSANQRLNSLESFTASLDVTYVTQTELAAATNRPDKFIGMHFFNPVPIMKLCEIVRGFATSDDTYSTIYTLSKELGKVPVTVQDYPGFISNRILMPMINEAIYCLMFGVS